MTIGHLEHEIWTDKCGLLRMIRNGRQDKNKPNYLFISSLSLNLKLNDCGHAHKSSQSWQKSKLNIVHHNNHPSTQETIIQLLKRKETKHTLAHLCVFITYLWEILLWVDVGASVGVSMASSIPWGQFSRNTWCLHIRTTLLLLQCSILKGKLQVCLPHDI